MAETIYSLEQISGWQSELMDFAKTPRTRFSKKQAVVAMIDEIEAALEAHPYEQVAEKLKALGLDIAPGSLKQYVNAYRREHGTGSVTTAAKRSRKKAKQKKAEMKATEGAGRSAVSVSARRASQEGEVLETSNNSGVASRVRKVPEKAPDGFLEMAEDL
ncbi:hypothetical protein [cf. Phormidesmis sp. LEGE 11477]|uniref:hypothetical protein n=1 Tax=cf. Phormidesmis sp. LEGE 11477 TaxID=1828680 RepID=UPI00187FD3E1|nr:hypothetical protein [cf. Phormidesmis sp. LEGE 11477]MBE9063187.1 hypothetical protein [cf. Phormidesmis sp. LEGE 11477]